MARFIKCSNEDGMELTFGETFSPFLLENCEGIYTVQNNVVTSENTMTDGATYQGSTIRMRNIVLTLRDYVKSDHQENRFLLYSLFKSKSAGMFTYFEDEGTAGKSIRYHVESVEIDSVNRARKITVSLLCPDPLFEGLEDITVEMAGWRKTFQWPHEFTSAKEPFGVRVSEIIKEIDNDCAADHIGLEILMQAYGAVTNPALYHVEQGEYIKVGTADHVLQLSAGDAVKITTGTGNKNVYLIRDGQTTKINEYLDEESEFLQLVSGKNTFKYDADTGIDHMNVSISYRLRYLGV